MDGDGREQDTGVAAPHEDEVGRAQVSQEGRHVPDESGPIRPEGRGQDRHGGGAFATDRSDKAVSIQSIVETDDYAKSAESGI